MPLIKADNFNEDLEDKLITKEGNYDLRIVKSEYKATKAGDNHMVVVMLAVEGAEGEGLVPFNHYMVVPAEDMSGEYDKMRLRDLKRFLSAFGVNFSNGWDPEEDAAQLKGQTANVLVKLEKGANGEPYPTLRLPKLG